MDKFTIGQLRAWLTEAKVRDNAAAPPGVGRASVADFSLARAGDDLVGKIARDLDGVHDMAAGIQTALTDQLAAVPSGDALETCLIEIESHLTHGLSHWRSMVAILHQMELWPRDDSDPE